MAFQFRACISVSLQSITWLLQGVSRKGRRDRFPIRANEAAEISWMRVVAPTLVLYLPLSSWLSCLATAFSRVFRCHSLTHSPTHSLTHPLTHSLSTGSGRVPDRGAHRCVRLIRCYLQRREIFEVHFGGSLERRLRLGILMVS